MPTAPKVLLIGWDAADWKVIHPLMDAGQMPNVQRLVENGSIAQIATLNPPLSPMLWTSIATGKRPFQHGIHGFAEPTPDGNGIQPVSNLSRKCKAVWNILNQNGLRSNVIGWWPSHPAEPLDGVTVSDHFHKAYGPLEKGWPVLPASVHPWSLAEALAECRLHPDEVAGEMIDFFVPEAREIDQKKDRRLAAIAKTLCDCVSVHGAATWLLDHEPSDFFAVYYDAIDHFCHGFMRYHPPRQPHIPERDFELYRNVVSAAYRFHDQMLGALLARTGPETRVILMSDHGFHPDHLRPKAIPRIPAGPAIEHRDFGILALAGPGIKKDELLHGASVLDITPTVLALFDLPVGEDMDGKVLTAAFEQPREIRTIPSWEDVPGRDGRHPPHTRLDPEAARESLQQLVALGYIEKPDESREKAVAHTMAELRYNLGEAYQDAGRHAEALEIFRELHESDPDEQRHAVHYFVSCQALGRVAEMRVIVDELDGPRRQKFLDAARRAQELIRTARQRAEDRKKAAVEASSQEEDYRGESLLDETESKEFKGLKPLLNFQPPVVEYLKGQVFTAERKWGEALDCLQRVQEADLARPGLFLQTAALYQRLKQWEDAERTYRKALAVDPDNPHAHIGLCRAALRRRDFAAAAQSALDGLQRLYHNPVGHFLLGVSLVRMGDYERARAAFETALSLNPNFRQAHLRLGYLFKRRLHDEARAARHFRLFREMRASSAGARHSDSGAVPQPRPAAPAPPVPEFAHDAPRALPPLHPEEVVIVSGLPRSGTSMLMQMLAAGGFPILTDGRREADEDNPLGYLEYEPVKQLLRNRDWLPEARGKVVKIVAPLLPGLPDGQACRVIFVDRNLDEILASQRQMLLRGGKAPDDNPARTARLKAEYGRVVLSVRKFLKQRPRTEVLRLHRDSILADPQASARALNTFLGGGWDADAMAAAVRPELNRQRAARVLQMDH
jgi:predicted AlkP superfamily phosphohydrolase/phosphomutase/tetratricopeptide (TPR) repeat protein